MTMFRQGDVVIERVENIPNNTKPVDRDNGRVILAYGEVTGHAHAIVDDNVELVEVDTDTVNQMLADVERFLSVEGDKPCELKHEEHATIVLPPGNYRVVIQREYSPEGIRNVAD